MTHSFDTEIALIVGIEAATIYQNILFWCSKNEANEKHIHDGKAWTYNSKKAFLELFPYLSERKIKTALETLKEHGFILYRNDLNENKMDHTNWYHAVPKAPKTGRPIDQYESAQSNGTNQPNGTDENVPTYTRVSTDPDSKHTDSKPLSPLSPKKSSTLEIGETTIDHSLIQSFITHRQEIKKPMTQTALNLFIKKLESLQLTHDIFELVNESIIGGYQGVFPKEPTRKPQQPRMDITALPEGMSLQNFLESIPDEGFLAENTQKRITE